MRVYLLQRVLLFYCILFECGAFQNETTEIPYVFANEIHCSNTRRIFGGRLARHGEAPYVVALLGEGGRQMCSGTAIASHWCLTAAHCVVTVIKLIRYNSMNALSGGKIVGVSAKYKHPEYNVVFRYHNGQRIEVRELYHDVGLIRTKQQIVCPNFPEVNPRDVTGRFVEVFGFGRISEGMSQSHDLMMSTYQITSCNVKRWVYCSCAYSATQDSALCSGDSGGPSFLKGTIVSISSMGPRECNPSAHSPYSVVTKLSPYVTIINNTIMGKRVNAFVKVDAAENIRLNGCLLLVVFAIIYI